jgi:hypothetical protein
VAGPFCVCFEDVVKYALAFYTTVIARIEAMWQSVLLLEIFPWGRGLPHHPPDGSQ